MSLNWPKVQLSDLTEKDRSITYGVVKPGDEFDDGVAFIRGGDISEGRIAIDVLRTISPQLSQTYKRTLLHGGELLISLVGNPGEVAIAPALLEGANIARQVGLIAIKPEVDTRYVMYFLMSPMGRAELFTRTGGAVQQVINLADLKTVMVPLPSFVEQKRFSEILTTYDDLIDNNRRRMALLEDSARQLYREWFVRLRFPGHEHTPIVDGVPQGWELKTLGEVCISGHGIQTGPFGSQLHQADYSDEGVPVVMPKDIIDFRVAVTTIARIPEDLANRLGRHRMMVGDTVYGRRGDIGRRAYIGKRQQGWFCGTGSLRIRPDPLAINPLYLFDHLGAPATVGDITNRAKGSTMLNLSAAALKPVPILLPLRSLQDLYADQVAQVREMVDVLDEQNQKLRQARDLLLPRLMNGDLAV